MYKKSKRNWCLQMHHSNGKSTEGLSQIMLHIPRRSNNNNTTTLIGKRSKAFDNSSQSPSPPFHFLIRNPCKDIIHIGANAEEYYHVELVCDEDNDTEYGIQAYGHEAKELCKEINGCTVTAPTTLLKNDYKHQEQELDQEKVNLKLVKDAINFITDSCLQSGCVLTFKKLGNVCVYKRKI
jgi:hypothetical protein